MESKERSGNRVWASNVARRCTKIIGSAASSSVVTPDSRPLEQPRSAAGAATHLARASSDRWLWMLMGVPAALVIGVARALTPDPSGMGTHAQLGLPPCFFHALTSWPCPACGLTTSFAHMARLEVLAACAAHPLGVPLFLATLAVVPLSLVGVLRGWSFGATWRALGFPRGLPWVVLAFMAAWIVRVAAVVSG